MLISSDIKASIKQELIDCRSIWIASAMITNSGWLFLQKNISDSATQFYLIGIDLATEPMVFDSILQLTEINARVYETKYTFHPKVYIIQKDNSSLTAFIGSSNTTSWGLEKNVEMNYQIHDQQECKKLIRRFNNLYSDGYLITQNFADNYKAKFIRASVKVKEIEKEALSLKISLTKNKEQYFSKNHHEIFNKTYHRTKSIDLQNVRSEVRFKFLELHNIIYPQFPSYGLTDLHCHHNKAQIVSRHYFNDYSGNYINAMWLHYGKSKSQLGKYFNGDKSTNKPDSFINNIRIQVIIHKDSIGIWLVLGRNKGSKIDRDYFRNQMKNLSTQKKFFDSFNKLGNEYWINQPNGPFAKNIKTRLELLKEIQKERLEEYFIIGRNIDWLDKRLSSNSLSTTILEEFKKLYPLYEIMRHK
ncbi:phospholipase D-like domain-containing protein [Spongiimicrobium sp. 3-5]|uniref:phospholipase D-like domain-containing protein n=1 Tax=Spongiimicrobium sp. 3-5 TaxID=3332596 RepID=UPI00397FAFD1